MSSACCPPSDPSQSTCTCRRCRRSRPVSPLPRHERTTQMTLMAFFVAFGVCQIAYGPVSDMVGRKPPLYFGLALFVLGSIGCAAAPTIGWLIGFRFLQGLGASAVMVIPRAIIRDLHTGPEATRLMALVMLVFSVSPILAPLAGSALICSLRLARRIRRGDPLRRFGARLDGDPASRNPAAQGSGAGRDREPARGLRGAAS